MNIFEGLDLLLKNVNESSKTDGDYLDIPIAKDMMTAEQAIEEVRKQVIQELLKGMTPSGGEDSDDPEPPRVLPPTPPHIPITRKRLPSGGGSPDMPKDWEESKVCWDRDDFLEKLELEAEELEKEKEKDDEKDGRDYDDFLDSIGDGATGAEDTDKDDDSGMSKDEGDSDDEYDDKDSTESLEKKSKGGKKTSEKDSKDEGDKDEDGKGKTDLESAIKDAIEKLSERTESEKKDLRELIDMLKDDELTPEEIEEKEREMTDDKIKSREKVDKLKSLVGRIEKTPSREEIESEIEASGLSSDEIEELKKETVNDALSATPPTDAELDRLKKEAMVEMEKKCKGHSTIKTSILYHSLKTAKIEDEDWKKIVEKILNDKSINKGDFKEKTKHIKLGDKNHLWRHDVRYTKTYKKAGADTQSIYCFIDYSGSVIYRPGLIYSFLGKILNICEMLEYTDISVYTFGNHLSLPRVINNEMLKNDGYEKVLANTMEYFKLPENNVGQDIENFSEVGLEINRIKTNDKNAVIFIFGDGYWTFYYGQTHPPTQLNVICPQWIQDIIAFIFFDEIDTDLGKEISQLKDVVGIKDVILTKAKPMEKEGKLLIK